MRRALFLLLVVASAIVRAADIPDAQKTRAEATNFEETSRAADVDRVLSALAGASPNVTVTSFGKSEEGRPLPLAILSSPGVAWDLGVPGVLFVLFFFLLLQRPHLRVQAFPLQQLAMRAAFDDASVIHHQYLIGIHHRG